MNLSRATCTTRDDRWRRRPVRWRGRRGSLRLGSGPGMNLRRARLGNGKAPLLATRPASRNAAPCETRCDHRLADQMRCLPRVPNADFHPCGDLGRGMPGAMCAVMRLWCRYAAGLGQRGEGRAALREVSCNPLCRAQGCCRVLQWTARGVQRRRRRWRRSIGLVWNANPRR